MHAPPTPTVYLRQSTNILGMHINFVYSKKYLPYTMLLALSVNPWYHNITLAPHLYSEKNTSIVETTSNIAYETKTVTQSNPAYEGSTFYQQLRTTAELRRPMLEQTYETIAAVADTTTCGGEAVLRAEDGYQRLNRAVPTEIQ